MTTRTVPLFLLLSAFFIFFPACSSDDDPTTPEIPVYDDPVLAALTQECAILSQGMIDVFPNVATGNLGAKDAVDPYWDPSCTCWRWSSFEEFYGGPDSSWYRGWNFAVTFYLGETPQMEFAGADRITIQVGYSYNENNWTDENNYTNKNFYLNQLVEVTDTGEGYVEVSGSGSGQLSSYIAVDGETSEVYKDIIVSLYLTIPHGACPTGMLTLDFNPASFTVSFDHDGVAYWEYQVGPGDSDTGSFHLSCGN